ncbi:TVP38/TMEM64 family protein [Halosolutus amylolyticus]|uniref:TVP38/TMEM64 family protein n=1 Tax=Halosolutus amylolyticus TaxID=2932267 RepID=A0ABD5PNN5_9EURY|nr:TVP38/TMEM64 family protein [Halosolutus amylolyticus]
MSSATGRAIAGLLLVSGLVAVGMLVSPSRTIETVTGLASDPYQFAVVVAGLYLVRPLFAWPTTPLAVVVGYGYGVGLGVPIALLGVVTTVIPVFVAVRRLTGTGAAARQDAGTDGRVEPTAESGPATPTVAFGGVAGRVFDRTGTAIDRYYGVAGPLRGVVASRLAPIPSDVATATAAVSDVRLRHLVVGTAIGELPWTVAAVVVGASAATVTTAGLGDVGIRLTVGCAIAAGVLLTGPVYRVARTRRGSTESGHGADG